MLPFRLLMRRGVRPRLMLVLCLRGRLIAFVTTKIGRELPFRNRNLPEP